MKRTLPATATVMAFCLFFIAGSASAQFWPGYGHWGGGYGAWGAAVAAQADTTMRTIAQQEHATSERIAAQQSATMQANIRNTLNTQADMRTQNILSQQQSHRDWWFQVQQQQSAERRAMSAAARPSAGESFVPTVASSPIASAATDIIPWPPVLCDPRFAEQRALVEAPYRRSPAGQAAPTVEDYENMILAVEQMTLTLGQMTTEISAQQYLYAEKFLSQLADEARGRIKAR
ncbi:MAG: hypothetical protein RBS80_27375 [Thermoguttaceae bacterium]|jgi:hypothetical protein|nr:hypothetical protein [Thermoguttaceae bacterium]